MIQTIPLKEVREQLSDLVSQVAYGDQKVVITKFGKPVAVIVTYEDYGRITNPARQFTNKEWEKGFTIMDKMRENTKKYSKKAVQQAIDQAIREVRRSKRA